MRTIVITGSTRGIGQGLAKSFLEQGCQVVVSGRSLSSIDQAVQRLATVAETERIAGMVCDVTDINQVEHLWFETIRRFGRIDIWINNAGIGHSYDLFWEIPSEEVENVVRTNLIGMMNGSRVAMREMLKQRYGSIYNMEGMGSDGKRLQKKMTVYGASKAGVGYFTRSMALEARGTPVLVGSIRPGMVVTELLTKPFGDNKDEFERTKPIFNILAEKVGTVTPWMAQQVLKNTKHGALIRWNSTWKILGRFLVAPFHKRDLFSGNPEIDL
jgi:NAD(P)-dependent dehydrogenase (short-subunit alcohol dehydrogenase family)